MTLDPTRGPAERAHDARFREGDPVLLLDAKQRGTVATLRKGGRSDARGRFAAHDALVDLEVGRAVEVGGAKQVALRPTLAEFALSMPRCGTPTYPKDLGALLVQGDIFPGAVALECGTGSGALTLGLLRAVGPTGRVISYETRGDFSEKARENVRAWHGGDPPNLTLRVADIYFAIQEEDRPLDRIVLDLAEPWRVVPHAVKALRPGGLLAAFVPTIPQVQQLVEALCEAGFVALEALEANHRRWHVAGRSARPEQRPVGHTGFLVFARRALEGSAKGATPDV
jgi:tRNA (adenine57-N1/adenine58-N1)-methyltransferase catalytic subunit